jgi:hypothetical protein
MSYNIELFFAINETVETVDFDSVIKLDNLQYIKNKIDFIKNLTSKYKMDINFEDYDIECNKDKTNNIATKKNIGIVIENNIIDFIKEIKENYSISLITNNDTDQIIFCIKHKNIKNLCLKQKINIKTELDRQIYDLVYIN